MRYFLVPLFLFSSPRSPSLAALLAERGRRDRPICRARRSCPPCLPRLSVQPPGPSSPPIPGLPRYPLFQRSRKSPSVSASSTVASSPPFPHLKCPILCPMTRIYWTGVPRPPSCAGPSRRPVLISSPARPSITYSSSNSTVESPCMTGEASSLTRSSMSAAASALGFLTLQECGP